MRVSCVLGTDVFQKQRDKYLWGHPSGAVFNSPNRFFPHFYYLMTGGTTQCPCDLCTHNTKGMLTFKTESAGGEGDISPFPPFVTQNYLLIGS